jgi:GAF domain-containing protein
MADQLVLPTTRDRALLYEALLPQVEALLAGEGDAVAAMANTAATLHTAFGWHWVGFYRVLGQELVLGPFQGPIACTRIAKGKGVCGTSWAEARTIVVPDVERFPGHIACSALSRSEIVVPVLCEGGQVVAVLDIDSTERDDFSQRDAFALERICMMLAPLFR